MGINGRRIQRPHGEANRIDWMTRGSVGFPAFTVACDDGLPSVFG